jgi:predicted MPP superfamily phosphohydrolase/sugar phosphate isomerase/epimerase
LPRLLRLVILGDPHIHESDLPLWEQGIADINTLKPDHVLVVGDLTGGHLTGTPQGMKLAVSVLDRLDAPWHTVIGNHDLQAKEFDHDDAAVANFLQHVGRKQPWFTLDAGPLTVIGLSNTQWRQNPGTKNEIVINEPQRQWCVEQLERLADRPVFVLCHVPPIGSGLMTMAELHAFGGNAYANQNHMPGEVMGIVWEHPNVLAWFSGHNHLGQHYRDALSMRLGVQFAHTGVIGSHNRDGHRHSRVVDVYDTATIWQTYDHTRQCMDPALMHREPYSLDAMLAYRRRIHRKANVPRDPATMRQGPSADSILPEAGVRFAFLSDAHIVEAVNPCQQRVIEWSLQQIRSHMVDRVVLGGDLTHHASAEQAHRFLEALPLGKLPVTYLPGNNEGVHLRLDGARFRTTHWVNCVQRLEDWPGEVYALATACPQDVRDAVAQLAQLLPDQGLVLVLAHFPPDTIGQQIHTLNRPGLHIHWICGHRHEARTWQDGNVTVHVCAGLDPVKVRGQLPEIVIGDWDGQNLHLSRSQAPQAIINSPSRRFNPLGLAYRDTVEGTLETSFEHGIGVLQLHHSVLGTEPSPREDRLLSWFRHRFHRGFLSLHMPNFSVAGERLSLADMEPALRWAEAGGLDDLTIHMPNVPVSMLFDQDQQFLDTPWARSCLEVYAELAKRALAINASLSIENVYNKDRVPPDQEKLSCRPWHLTRFVQRLRQMLRQDGCLADRVQRVGIIFDAGHAFRDAVVSKIHGLADWIDQIADYMQLAHIHQTDRHEGKMRNHQPITDATGPLINYAGLLEIIEQRVPRQVPLLIEVRTREGALTSRRALCGIHAPLPPELPRTRRAAHAE